MVRTRVLVVEDDERAGNSESDIQVHFLSSVKSALAVALVCAGMLCLPLLSAHALEPSPTTGFITTFGDNSVGIGIALDAAQNVYVEAFHFIRFPRVGFFPVPKTSKLSSQGEVLWSVDFLSSQGQPPTPPIPVGIAVDPAGNSYVLALGLGWLGSFINTGVLLKYDTNGVLILTQAVPHPSDETSMSGIVYDPSTSHLYVAGSFPFRRPNAPDVQDTMVLEYDTNLNLLAENVVEDNAASLPDEAVAIAVDGLGNVHVGANQFNFQAPPPFFLTINWLAVKFSPHLSRLLSKQVFSFGPPNVAVLSGIAADAQGNSYLAGRNSRPNFLPEAVLLKSANGYTSKFHSSTDTPSIDGFFSVAVDSATNAYVTGFSIINFTELLFRMIKYDPRGDISWNLVLSDFSIFSSARQGIALDGKNNIYVVGTASNGRTVVAKFGKAQNTALKIVLAPSSVLPLERTGDATGAATQVEVDVVDQQGNPLAKVTPVTLSVSPIANSGGHNHDGIRPVGVFSGLGIAVSSVTQASTGPDGKLFVTYTSAFVGGLETITAALTDTPSVSTSAVLEVKVPGLVQAESLVGTSPVGYSFTGATPSHTANHFVTGFTIAGSTTAAIPYFEETGGQAIGLNDMSLISGGVLDVGGDWNPPHNLHQVGHSVDVDRCAASPTGLALVDQDELDRLMLMRGGNRIVESPPRNKPIPDCATVPIHRIHYEFSQ